MREYAKVAPEFWTRGSGKRLRGDTDAQVLALYLVTCPCANMIGIYYVPWVAVVHETGMGEERASAAMARLRDHGFADYDVDAELAWVPNMASYQIGEKVKPADNRHKAVRVELARVASHRFAARFVERYGSAYNVRLDCDDPPASDHMFLDPLRRGVKPSAPPSEAGLTALGRAGAGAGAEKESESAHATVGDSESEVTPASDPPEPVRGSRVPNEPPPRAAATGPSRPDRESGATLAGPGGDPHRKSQPGAKAPANDPRGPVDCDQPVPDWATARYGTYQMTHGLQVDLPATWAKYLSHISDKRQAGEARPIGEGSWNKWLLDSPRFGRAGTPNGQPPAKAIARETRRLPPEERPTKPTSGSLLDYIKDPPADPTLEGDS